MQPINEILKEIQFPIWLCWGASIIAMVASSIGAMLGNTTGAKALLAALPTTGLVVLLFTMGLIFYCANDSIGKRKEQDQERTKWKKEMAVMKTSWNKEKAERTLGLDWRLQSIEGIIGYLDQSIKMGHEPKELVPITLFLAKEIQSIRDRK
ncbi:MAG: hypothetical protein WCP39_01790 [Chlamydiota bacterium]